MTTWLTKLSRRMGDKHWLIAKYLLLIAIFVFLGKLLLDSPTFSLPWLSFKSTGWTIFRESIGIMIIRQIVNDAYDRIYVYGDIHLFAVCRPEKSSWANSFQRVAAL